MDKIFMYNMKTPYEKENKNKRKQNFNKSEKIRKRKKNRSRNRPSTSLNPPSSRLKKNRESLDFFTNG